MGEDSQGRHHGSNIGSRELPNDSTDDVTKTRGADASSQECTADGSDASHAAHEARGDGIGKREKVAWVARDRQDKGQGLLDVAREMYKLTACTTIESNEVNPPVLAFP